MIKFEKFGKVIDYVRNDLTNHYGLKQEVSIVVSGDDVTDLFGCEERMICVPFLTIWSDTTENKVVLTAHPFTANDKMWNGPNVIPNTYYESMLASLFHDLLYSNLELLSKQINKPTSEVRAWSDKILYCVWNGASRSKIERFKARIGYGVCRAFGGIFTSLTKWFIFIITILAITGCCVPDWHLDDVQGEEAINEVISNGNK